MSQGPTLVGPQVAFYECGLQPLRHALLRFRLSFGVFPQPVQPVHNLAKIIRASQRKNSIQEACNKGTGFSRADKGQQNESGFSPCHSFFAEIRFSIRLFRQPCSAPEGRLIQTDHHRIYRPHPPPLIE